MIVWGQEQQRINQKEKKQMIQPYLYPWKQRAKSNKYILSDERTNVTADFFWPQTTEWIMFLITTSLELALWILSQPANENQKTK